MSVGRNVHASSAGTLSMVPGWAWLSLLIFFLPKRPQWSCYIYVVLWCENTFKGHDKAVHSSIAHRGRQRFIFQLSSDRNYLSLIRMKIGIYVFLANIPRFTTQKLAGKCSELLLYNRNVFSSKVCYIRNRTGLDSTLRLCICLAKLTINTMFIIEQKAPVPFLKHLWFITTSLLDLNGQIPGQRDVRHLLRKIYWNSSFLKDQGRRKGGIWKQQPWTLHCFHKHALEWKKHELSNGSWNENPGKKWPINTLQTS